MQKKPDSALEPFRKIFNDRFDEYSRLSARCNALPVYKSRPTAKDENSTMRFLGFSIVLLGLLFASGCRSILKPSAEERNASYTAIASKMRLDADQMLKRTYFVLSGGDDLRVKSFSPSADGNGAQFEIDGVSEQGLAVVIAEDGYLLTAAHVVKEHSFVLGWIDGRVDIKGARVVTREHGDRYGSEFAVLAVEGQLHPPTGWSRDLATGDRLIAVGSDFQAGGGLVLLGGQLRVKESLEQRYGMTLLYTTVPVWHGDSGGPLYGEDGGLVGINVAYRVRLEGLGFKYHRIACIPSESKLAEILERDREARDSLSGDRRVPAVRPRELQRTTKTSIDFQAEH